MTTPNVIGVYVYKGGGWQRTNAGTPTGYSGPQVYKAGAWWNCLKVRAKASSVWQHCWVNIDYEVTGFGQSSYVGDSIDISSPYSAEVQFWINSDGSIDAQENPGSYPTRTEISGWRAYDCGRTYEVKYVETLGAFNPWDTHPTLDTYGTSWSTFNIAINTNTLKQCKMTVYIRHQATASNEISAEFTAYVEGGFGG